MTSFGINIVLCVKMRKTCIKVIARIRMNILLIFEKGPLT